MGYLNSPIVVACLQTLSPTLDYHEGPMGKVPYEDIENVAEIDVFVKSNITISKLDWDSHETSWDFQQNELISLIDFTEQDITTESLTTLFSTTAYCDAATPQADNNPHTFRLQDLMDLYHQKWSTFFMQLQTNEEELNRQFIDIYDLQDELTPDVPLNEITILQQGEVSIEGNALKWHDEVILKQFLSYAAGVWMGRYRLGNPGLHIAHPNPTAEELKAWWEKSGLPLKKFFNTSGLVYKEQNLKERLPDMSEEEQLALLATNGMLVKRPLVIGEDFVLIGFKEAEWERLK